MENKIEENVEILLVREPALVDTIIEILSKQAEDLKLLMEKDSLVLQD